MPQLLEAVPENAISGLKGANIRLPVGYSPESGSALVRRQIGQVVARANGGTAVQQRPCQRRPTIIRQRPEHRIASQRSSRRRTQSPSLRSALSEPSLEWCEVYLQRAPKQEWLPRGL